MPELKIDADIFKWDSSEEVEEFRSDVSIGKNIGSMKEDSDGYLIGEAPIAKVGIMRYLRKDGTVLNEFVPPETLFDAESMSTLRLRPMTNDHPVDVMMLDASNVKFKKVGSTGDISKQDGGFLVVSMAITDADAVSAVKNGRSQLSPGYRCNVVMREGFFQGQKYDAVQVRRRYNHVAICDKARGGDTLKINMDSFDGYVETIYDKGVSMPKYVVNGIAYEAAQEVINLCDSLQKGIADLTSAKCDAVKATDSLQAKFDVQSVELEALKKRDVSGEIAAGVKERVQLVQLVTDSLTKEELEKINIDSLSNAALKRSFIAVKQPKANLEGRNDAYVESYFTAVVDSLGFDTDAEGSQRRDSAQRQDGKGHVDIVEKARLDSIKAMQTAHLNLK